MALRTMLVCLLVAVGVIPSLHAQPQRYWIVFRDKGICAGEFHEGTPLFDSTVAQLSRDCLKRRSRTLGLPPYATISLEDAPVCTKYTAAIQALGVGVHVASRWSNAVSAEMSDAQLAAVRNLPFVRGVVPVATEKPLSLRSAPVRAFAPSHSPSLWHTSAPDTNSGYAPVIFHYGGAEPQLDRINVIPLHALGLDATGVRLGFLDTGFRWREISSLATRHVVCEHDYVFHDDVTENQEGDNPDQQSHGTETFSTAMGYDPDHEIGPAFNASVMLAKTEDIRSESPVEEDNYAAALEDFEAKGVDITTSSLGYFTFDPGWTSYTYSDMNGRTTISAQACARAQRLGVLVVTAMGNSGETEEPHLDTPADADSIISVGALAPDNTVASFSSRGPTSDGRIKPEICAPGVGVYAQGPDGLYRGLSGTSFATPLTSAACCLIRQAHPEASAQQVRAAVMRTGDNAAHPDTAYGWGRLNAYAAALELGDILHLRRAWFDTVAHVTVGAASKFGVRQVHLRYNTVNGATSDVPMVLSEDSLIYTITLPPTDTQVIQYTVVLTNGDGRETILPSSGVLEILPPKAELSVAVYPNPVGAELKLLANRSGKWSLYNDAGQFMRSVETSVDSTAVMDVRDIANGAYYVMFVSDDGETSTVAVAISH